MQVLYVSDGKAGHRSQALCLFNAMPVPKVLQEIKIDELSIFKLLFRQKPPVTPPNFIVGVGSHTHLKVWLLGRIYPKAKTIILMKPSLPISWFDYAVIPKHDGVLANQNVILTQGALNPIINEGRHQADRILIALGGNSKRHQWDEQKVLSNIQNIVSDNPLANIILTTSRRTPSAFLNVLKQYNLNIEICPVQQTPQGWIFEQMQLAQAVWVTEDSVSMIYEALTAGCQVGLIALPRIKTDRITQSVDDLLKQHKVSLNTSLSALHSIQNLNEAQVVVDQLLR